MCRFFFSWFKAKIVVVVFIMVQLEHNGRAQWARALLIYLILCLLQARGVRKMIVGCNASA